MSLTKEDLQELSKLMDASLRPIREDIASIKSDIINMKSDITSMKSDITNVKQEVLRISLHLENVTDRNISIVAENHSNLITQLNEAIPRVSKEPIYEIKVNCLEEDVKQLKKAVKELQNRTA